MSSWRDDCGQRGEHLALDEAAAGVVAAEAAAGRLHDPLALGHREPQVGRGRRARRGPPAAARSRSRTALASTSAMRASPLTLAASGVSMPPNSTSGTRSAEHDLLDAGLAERRQHLLDVAQEHPVRAR